MRFEVPQFIEVEDKIVGPLTWKQFIYLAGGGGLVVALYLNLPFLLFALFGIPIGAFAGFLAFHKVNNRPFSIFLESAINYLRKSKLYLWRKDHEQTIIHYSENAQVTNTVVSEKRRLNSLAEKLEFYSLEK